MRLLRPILALAILCLAAAPALAGREVYNSDGHLDRVYKHCHVKNRTQDRVIKDVEVDVEENWVEVRLPEGPIRFKASNFYDWGYQLEISGRHSDTGDLYIITIDQTGAGVKTH